MMQFISLVLARVAATRDDDRGASMVEYGLLVALIAVVVAVVAQPLGTAIADLFTEVIGYL